MPEELTSGLLLLAGGLLAGSLGGLLGIGGGIVLMPLLRFGVELPPAQAAGTCILAVLFTTLGGSYRHVRLGHVDLRSVLPCLLSGAVACAVLSLLFRGLAQRGHWLDLGIGLVFCAVSARMLAEGIAGLVGRRRGQPGSSGSLAGTLPRKAAIGVAGGVLPGLLGIGTGGILVPAFTFLLRAPVKTAMAASLACFSCNAAISSAFKASQGFVVLQVAWPLCLGTLVGANLGAVLNRRFSSGAVKLVFGAVFACVALKFVLSFSGAKA